MSHAHFRFYAELNDFLPRVRRQRTFTHDFDGRVSVKDMIESLGVPHTEVDLILVNGRSADFSYLVAGGDRISIYPAFRSLEISLLSHVHSEPLPDNRFALDAHLGRLAAYLRLLGFDALYDNGYSDEELARISSQDHRILLTRDRGLLKRSEVKYGYCIRSTVSQEQLLEVVRRYDLVAALQPGTRCVHCNGLLRLVPKAEVIDRLPPRTQLYYDKFWVCQGCDQVYWQGSHYPALKRLIALVQSSHPAG